MCEVKIEKKFKEVNETVKKIPFSLPWQISAPWCDQLNVKV